MSLALGDRLRVVGNSWRHGGAWPRIAVSTALVLGVLSALAGPKLYGDSTGYLENSPFRPPLFPLLLDLVELVFGSGFLRAAVALQVAAGAGASYVLARELAAALGGRTLALSLVFGTLLLPHVYYGRGRDDRIPLLHAAVRARLVPASNRAA